LRGEDRALLDKTQAVGTHRAKAMCALWKKQGQQAFENAR
jgi:hypothetical protein